MVEGCHAVPGQGRAGDRWGVRPGRGDGTPVRRRGRQAGDRRHQHRGRRAGGGEPAGRARGDRGHRRRHLGRARHRRGGQPVRPARRRLQQRRHRRAQQALHEMDLANWEKVRRINGDGVFTCCGTPSTRCCVPAAARSSTPRPLPG
ncbi:hypothetical protein V2I01_18185 [Micromonospora sp. BRA006-A]|nr:hypothetical protein [Micromonospora sp. BRA006-A]